MSEVKESKDEQLHQYDEISVEYASLAEVDPAKRYVQYPSTLKMLGNVRGKKVLDVGCGAGNFTRILAKLGANVFGYDPSVKQIEQAQKKEDEQHLGIKYSIGDRPEIPPDYKLDEAVSTMVLMYAADKENLLDIFTNVYSVLAEKGSFTSIIYNPNFKGLGKVAYKRRFSKAEDGKVKVDFLDDQGEQKISAKFSDFSVADYENAAREAGFKKVEWVKLEVISEGQKTMGDEFWKDFKEDSPYIGIKVSK
jgi:ubiquinone/menaquinone biosynthesis C-methylase UbiE